MYKKYINPEKYLDLYIYMYKNKIKKKPFKKVGKTKSFATKSSLVSAMKNIALKNSETKNPVYILVHPFHFFII